MKPAELLSSNPRRNPVGYSVLALLGLYVALLAAPGFLFAESSHIGGMTVYSHAATPGLEADVAKAEASLARSPINDPQVAQRVFLTGSHHEYAAFAPGAAHAFGATYNLLANSFFLAPSDSAADRIHAHRAAFNTRPLSAVIAHERMHVLVEHHFGVLATMRAPAWKLEGYCDYIAGGASIATDDEGLALLRSAPNDPAVAYFRDTLRVRYLLDKRHLTVDQLFSRAFDLAQLDREAMRFYVEK